MMRRSAPMLTSRTMLIAGVMIAGCAPTKDTVHVDLGRRPVDPFSDRSVSVEVVDRRELAPGMEPNTIGRRGSELIRLTDQDVTTLVREAVVDGFRRSGLSVPEQPDPSTTQIIVEIDRLWLELVSEATMSRVEFDGVLRIRARGQTRTVTDKFDAGAFGATRSDQPFGKVLSKGLRRLEKQIETLGVSLAKTSSVSN